jgi:Glyoxalase-like domain
VYQREGGKIAGEKPVAIGKIIRAPRKIRDVRPRYRDLRSAVAQFRAMGFTIKPGRPHQNGIENVSIKFADGSYVELITAHNGTDSLAKQYAEMLKTGPIGFDNRKTRSVPLADEARLLLTPRISHDQSHLWQRPS